MNGFFELRIVLVSVFFFWTLYNIPIFLTGLKRYKNTGESKDNVFYDYYQPKVSIIVPVKNEDKVIGRLLESLVKLTYTKKEVIIVEDGSSDNTVSICRQYAEKYPSLIKFYHRRISSGKPSAINHAVKTATGEIIAIYDADTIIEPDVLEKIIPYFKDEDVAAVQGELYTVNPDDSLITKVSVLNDFLTHVQQLGKEKLGLFIASLGTHTYFRRKSLEELGFWDSNALVEDLEISVRLARRGYKIRYVPVKAGIEVPAKLSPFIRQRLRWFRGHIQTAGKHKNLLRSLSRKSIDAQLTLLIPLVLPLSLLGYITGILGIVGSQTEQVIGTVILLVSISTPLTVATADPKSFTYAPLLYLNWLLIAFISMVACLYAALRRPLKWTKTEKSGSISVQKKWA
jgi:cellulose synthase/poly-beta-1,6-N-acetylglucosamine synthase-like glycosyltransferase